MDNLWLHPMITQGSLKNQKANLRRKDLSFIFFAVSKGWQERPLIKKRMQIIKNSLKLSVQVFMRATEQIQMHMDVQFTS